MTDLVQKIREALAKITSWPWEIEQETLNCLEIYSKRKLVCQVIDNDGEEITERMAADAQMIIRAAPWLSEAAEEIERLQDHLQTNHDIAVVSFSRAGVRHDKESCATCKVLGVIQKETP